MSSGLLFYACPFYKSPLYVSLLPVSFLPVPCRKPYFCQLLLGSSHPLFIHLQGKGIPAHVAFPVTCILSLSHSDIDYVWLRQVEGWDNTDLFLSFPKYKDKGKDLYTFNDTTGKTNANQYLKHLYVIALQSASNYHVFWLKSGRELSQITRWYDLSYAQGAYMPLPYHEEHEVKSEIEKEETKKAATFLPQPYIGSRI